MVSLPKKALFLALAADSWSMIAARPSPEGVPPTPSEIMPVMVEAGQGLVPVPQVFSPACDCIRPGLACDPYVVWTLTQPLDSCITVARIKRASTLAVAAMARMLLPRLAVSSGELFGPIAPMLTQLFLIRGRLAFQLVGLADNRPKGNG